MAHADFLHLGLTNKLYASLVSSSVQWEGNHGTYWPLAGESAFALETTRQVGGVDDVWVPPMDCPVDSARTGEAVPHLSRVTLLLSLTL